MVVGEACLAIGKPGAVDVHFLCYFRFKVRMVAHIVFLGDIPHEFATGSTPEPEGYELAMRGIW